MKSGSSPACFLWYNKSSKFQKSDSTFFCDFGKISRQRKSVSKIFSPICMIKRCLLWWYLKYLTLMIFCHGSRRLLGAIFIFFLAFSLHLCLHFPFLQYAFASLWYAYGRFASKGLLQSWNHFHFSFLYFNIVNCFLKHY